MLRTDLLQKPASSAAGDACRCAGDAGDAGVELLSRKASGGCPGIPCKGVLWRC